jgi:phosphatidylserine/phosphatidylglycerophosphate/cardiolipin synthase-like enzyme
MLLGWALALPASCAPGPGLVTGPRAPAPPAPQAGGATSPAAAILLVLPDDPAAPLLQAIRGAQLRVWLTMYLLTSADTVTALIAARQAGCDVRVLLEAAPYGAETANLEAMARLAAAGIDVRAIDRPAGYLHEKALVIDGRAAYVMSLNLTAAGLAGNREYAVVTADPGDVAWIEAVFTADATGATLAAAPSPTRVVVSPIDARRRLTAAIDGARANLSIEMEELSDDAIADHLVAARARGVAVRLVAPARNRSPATSATLVRLAAAGLDVHVVDRPTIHAKAMSLDGARLYVGSVNLTRASLDDNRELGILLDDAAGAARIARTIAADAAAGGPP